MVGSSILALIHLIGCRFVYWTARWGGSVLSDRLNGSRSAGASPVASSCITPLLTPLALVTLSCLQSVFRKAALLTAGSMELT